VKISPSLEKNLQSETHITGFFGRGDFIKEGLQSGAIYGALFGTVFSALSGFGVLFVPFVGTVVAGGPIGADLLGATSGAIAGGAGVGIISALVSLGMPKEKAAIYETKIKAGGLMLTAETNQGMAAKLETLFREQGGTDILSCKDFLLSRFDTGPVNSIHDLPDSVRSRLSSEAQETFVKVYNQVYAEQQNQHVAAYRAWMRVEDEYQQNDQGIWTEPKALANA
jgi:cation transport regulator ChaB